MTLDETVLADLREGERAFPIYQINIFWSESYPPGAEDRIHRSDRLPLPDGRFWNNTGWDKMYPEDRDPEEIKAELLRDWWPKYVEEKKLLEPANLSVTVTLKRRDVWCEGWFSHWTFDVGMSDQDVIASFERYVERVQRSNLTETEKGSMLMGAEDHSAVARLRGR